jgi:hypothetical protein
VLLMGEIKTCRFEGDSALQRTFSYDNSKLVRPNWRYFGTEKHKTN